MTQFGASMSADGVVGNDEDPENHTLFGFKVLRDESDGSWVVELPHQCEEWEITDAPHEVAVQHLAEFIAEAQAALEALKDRQEIGGW
jgi:hypothetical protein